MATATTAREMTPGQMASALGIKDWQLTRLFARGLAAEPRRIGRVRVFTIDDLPRLRAAAVRAGYLPADAAAGQPAGDA
jgi:hypothetical protein